MQRFGLRLAFWKPSETLVRVLITNIVQRRFVFPVMFFLEGYKAVSIIDRTRANSTRVQNSNDLLAKLGLTSHNSGASVILALNETG